LMLRTVFWNKERPVSLSPEEGYRPEAEVIRTAARLGLPYIGERLTINLGQIFMTTLVAHVGTVALAANHIATTAEGMCYLPAYGVSFAATALVGQAVGARDREDARAYGRLSGLLGFFMCLCTGSLLFLLASPIASIFTPDAEVIRETAKVLRIVAFSEPLFAVSIVMSGALRGARDTACPMFIGLGCMWGIRAVLAPVLIYGFGWGLEAVWTAMALDLSARGILSALRWHLLFLERKSRQKEL
jgi:putative MATE family efflux protein